MTELTTAIGGVIPILKMGNALLKTVSTEVTEFNSDLTDLANVMARTMIQSRGVGLSAIQIGVTKRVIVALDGDTLYAMVNPVITRTLNRMSVTKEGCLSIEPIYWCKVSRPAKCEVEFQDLQGNPQQLKLSGNLARIVQHEIDHLNGILITDKPRIY